MEDKYKAAIAITGIVCVCAYGAYMAHLGINSALATSIIGTISAIIGTIFGVVIRTKKSPST